MEDKYYTPELEEFHIGFEYEAKLITKDWVKLKLDAKNYYLNIDRVLNLSETIRVKKLDREDIESFGWSYIPTKSIGKDSYEGLFSNSTRGKMLFEHDWLNNKITIKTPNYIRDASGRFDGYIIYVNCLIIKNKSELARLLKQLGII